MDKIFAALGGTTKIVDLIVKIILAIAIFLLLRSLYIKWKRRNAGKAWVDTSQLDPSKNYDNIAKQVNDTFTGWAITTSGSEIEEVSKQLMFLTDNELKQVNNRFVDLYGGGKKTLQDVISGWGGFCLNCPTKELLLERLNRLNIN